MPKPRPLHPYQLRAEIRRRGLLQKDVAAAIGVQPGTVSRALRFQIKATPTLDKIRTLLDERPITTGAPS